MRTPSSMPPSTGEDDRLREGDRRGSPGNNLTLDGTGEATLSDVLLTLNRPFLTSDGVKWSGMAWETPRPCSCCPVWMGARPFGELTA